MSISLFNEQFAKSALFAVVDNSNGAQTFFSDGVGDYFGLYDSASTTNTFSGSAGSSSTGTDAMPTDLA